MAQKRIASDRRSDNILLMDVDSGSAIHLLYKYYILYVYILRQTTSRPSRGLRASHRAFVKLKERRKGDPLFKKTEENIIMMPLKFYTRH